jgi:hypothetical protein
MFHVLPYGETPSPKPGLVFRLGMRASEATRRTALPTDFERGVMVGLLVGEGHFGGDGRQPQVTLRMHVRHEPLFNWIEETFPGGRLYGPYNHDGRHYFQWMARGSYLREVLMPILDEHLTSRLDAASSDRYEEMKARYHRRLRVASQAPPDEVMESPPSPEPVETREEGRVRPTRETSSVADIFERLRRERPL